MAKINYNGMELEEVTEPQIFDPPKTMAVWDGRGPNERKNESITEVFCILPKKYAEMTVVTANSRFGHCALLPEKTEPRRATNRELAKWIASGNGEVKDIIDVAITFYSYPNGLENTEVRDGIKVRKWDDTEWHKPDVEYMSIEEDK